MRWVYRVIGILLNRSHTRHSITRTQVNTHIAEWLPQFDKVRNRNGHGSV